MPGILIFVFFPLVLVLGSWACVAAFASAENVKAPRLGQGLLAGLFGLSALTVVSSTGDWVHQLWSVMYPLLGLSVGAGFLLVRVWKRDRVRPSGILGARNGATLGLLGIAILGLLPVVTATLFGGAYLEGRVEGTPVPALVQTALYGFGGPVPDLMEPLHRAQFERGLGSPPRFVGVPMGATFFAALFIVAFSVIAFVVRGIRSERARRAVAFLLPALLAIGCGLTMRGGGGLEDAVWTNEPWLVRAYGPVLMAALLSALTLGVAVWIDGHRAVVTDPSGPRSRRDRGVSNGAAAIG